MSAETEIETFVNSFFIPLFSRIILLEYEKNNSLYSSKWIPTWKLETKAISTIMKIIIDSYTKTFQNV